MMLPRETRSYVSFMKVSFYNSLKAWFSSSNRKLGVIMRIKITKGSVFLVLGETADVVK